MRSFRELAHLPRSLWMLSAAILVNRAGTMALPLLVLWLTERRGYTTDAASNVMIAYGAFALAGSLGSGFVCDRIGIKPVLVGSLVGMASVLFLLFGMWLLLDAALGWRWVAVGVTASIGTAAASVALIRVVRHRRAGRSSPAPLESSSGQA